MAATCAPYPGLADVGWGTCGIAAGSCALPTFAGILQLLSYAVTGVTGFAAMTVRCVVEPYSRSYAFARLYASSMVRFSKSTVMRLCKCRLARRPPVNPMKFSNSRSDSVKLAEFTTLTTSSCQLVKVCPGRRLIICNSFCISGKVFCLPCRTSICSTNCA